MRIRARRQFIAIPLLFALLICCTGALSLAASSSIHPCQCEQAVHLSHPAYTGCCCGCCGVEAANQQGVGNPSESSCNCTSHPASPLSSLLASSLAVGTSASGNCSLISCVKVDLSNISTFNLYHKITLPLPCARLLYLLRDVTHALPSLC